MKTFVLPAMLAAGLLTSCLPQTEPAKIYVSVQEDLLLPADSFLVGIEVIGRADTQAAAVEALAEELEQIRSTLPRLENLTAFSLDTGDVRVAPVPSDECIAAIGYRADDFCSPSSYRAVARLSVTGSPSTEAGNLISLATEIASGTVELSRFFIADPDAADRQALQILLEKARAEAELIASSSGGQVGGILEVRPPNLGEYAIPTTAPEVISVAAPDYHEQGVKTKIPVDQPSVYVTKNLLVVFELNSSLQNAEN